MTISKRPEIPHAGSSEEGGYPGKGGPPKIQPAGSYAAQSARNAQDSEAIAAAQPIAPEATGYDPEGLIGADLKDALVQSGHDPQFYEAVDLGISMIIIRTPHFNDVSCVHIHKRRSIAYRYIGPEIDDEVIFEEIGAISGAIDFEIE